MKGEIIKLELTFECGYREGDCKYKHPENYKICYGCTYAKVLNKRGVEK